MDKSTFKSSMLRILEQDVDGLSPETKIKYMRKWIKEYEQLKLGKPTKIQVPVDNPKDEIKIGLLVKTTLTKLIKEKLLTPEKVRFLQDERYCKTSFDINYPFLKKVEKDASLSEQRKINSYDRYWADLIRINQESYFVCNDWYERNRGKFVNWVRDIEMNR